MGGWDGLMLLLFLAYYVAFGPHGPRSPVNPPGTAVKILTGVTALIGTAGLLYVGFRSIGKCSFVYDYINQSISPSFKKKKKHGTAPPPPKTISKEWEDATNERAKELKINPISGPYDFYSYFSGIRDGCVGISSEGYSGKGFVTHK